MESLKVELRRKALKCFGVNILISLLIIVIPVLIFTFDSSGQDALVWRLKILIPSFFYFSILICCALMCLFLTNKLIIKFNYLIGLIYLLPCFIVTIISLDYFQYDFELSWISFSQLSLFLPFSIGQIISLFLVLKFIKKNRPKNFTS